MVHAQEWQLWLTYFLDKHLVWQFLHVWRQCLNSCKKMNWNLKYLLLAMTGRARFMSHHRYTICFCVYNDSHNKACRDYGWSFLCSAMVCHNLQKMWKLYHWVDFVFVYAIISFSAFNCINVHRKSLLHHDIHSTIAHFWEASIGYTDFFCLVLFIFITLAWILTFDMQVNDSGLHILSTLHRDLYIVPNRKNKNNTL